MPTSPQPPAPSPLPIDPLLPEIIAALRECARLVLRAPPGAGKTTRVPSAILDAGLAGEKDVVVLEPRRIAARAAAEYVACQRGAPVGGEVGYRIRYETRGGAATRLWFATEGILGRQLARDPFLERIGVVVLDEFHERHLPGDIAFGVVCELQETVRPDLKLVVMSATLDTDAVAGCLAPCRILTSEGRSHPVEIDYDPGRQGEPLSARVSYALRQLLARSDDGGDVLVFLPGAGEIQRAAEALAPLATEAGIDVLLLHGDLPLEAQQRALRRGPRRKIVLSTNVAETSLTIEGVTAVIDSGLARVARFDARRGVNALRLAAISRAAADQRAGRAGRTAPGRCVRLWGHAEQAQRRPAEVPEVKRLDLAATVLELRAWGLHDVSAFRWLDPPERGSLERAEALLRRLGAVEGDGGGLTETGRRMLELGGEPRLARILVEAERRGCAAEGALVAALASERDICVEGRAFAASESLHGAGASDLLLRAELFEEAAGRGLCAAACRDLDLDVGAVRAVERACRHFARLLRRGGPSPAPGPRSPAPILRCTLAGFPDRVARRRGPGSTRALMVGQIGIALRPESVVREAELFVAVELDLGEARAGGEVRVRLASAVEPAWLSEMFPASLRRESEMIVERGRVVARRRLCFEDLVLEEETSTGVEPLAAGEVLARTARADPRRVVPVGDEEETLLQRLAFLHRYVPELALPADPESLLADAVEAMCAGCRSLDEVRAQDLRAALLARLTHAQRQGLEREAPRELRLPSGRTVRLVYEAGKPPSASARIQEVFGLAATPRLAGGRVPLVLQLLAPNQRPVQITDDLASFWHSTYAEVRKQLRGRYPKHAWPEDPATALSHAGVRRR